MKILVCGGREYSDKDKLFNTLYSLCDEFKLWAEPDELGNTLPLKAHIISGAARGADSLAIDWAVINWSGLTRFPADWKSNGRAAGPLRNQQMLTEGKPDLVIAFPGGFGTRDMVTRAKAQGFKVREIN